uniref:Ig-like domain-containing protein n=1 Tax=Sphaeramia orbicularis TaxID=375764 RepID=A0A672ZR17_9TELE
MIRGLATLILLVFTQTRDDAEQVSWTVVKPGDNVTLLRCSFPKIENQFLYWYKMRFSATKVNTVYSPNIANVRKDDEAAYFCQTGSAYEKDFINNTILIADGKVLIPFHFFFTVGLSSLRLVTLCWVIKKINILRVHYVRVSDNWS